MKIEENEEKERNKNEWNERNACNRHKSNAFTTTAEVNRRRRNEEKKT